MNANKSDAEDRKDVSKRFVDAITRQGIETLLEESDQTIEEAHVALEKAIVAAGIRRLVCKELPDKLPCAPTHIRVDATVYKADLELSFTVSGAEQACDLADLLPPVPLVMVKAGCTAFVPKARFVEREGDKVEDIAGVVYRQEPAYDEFFWWSEIAGRLARISARTREGAPRKHGATVLRRKRLSEHAEEWTWTYEGLPAGKILQWASGSDLPRLSVTQRPDMTLRQALAKPQNYMASKRRKTCAC